MLLMVELERIFRHAAAEAEILAAGVDSAAMVHDRQVAQGIEPSPVVAAYVDNVAVIGESLSRVVDIESGGELKDQATTNASTASPAIANVVPSVLPTNGCGSSA